MIPIKIQCGCGQRYAFNVEPVNGQMEGAVACPVCGTDGTAAANQVIAQSLATQPQAAPASGLRLSPPAAPAAPVVRLPVLPTGVPRPAVRPTPSIKLAWYEQLWIALPFGLVAVGGAIGGACGGMAWAINKTVFTKINNPVLKYVLTGLISAAAVVVWLIVAGIILSLVKQQR
jgi:hypothetical protein